MSCQLLISVVREHSKRLLILERFMQGSILFFKMQITRQWGKRPRPELSRSKSVTLSKTWISHQHYQLLHLPQTASEKHFQHEKERKFKLFEKYFRSPIY